MSQAKASPVPAHEPMFMVPTVLRRVPSAVPPTSLRSIEHATEAQPDVSRDPQTRSSRGVLSAAAGKKRARNASEGPENVLRMFFNHL